MDNLFTAKRPTPSVGYLYLLHDGITGLSKIGCTKTSGSRQKAIMGAHSNVLVNVLNLQVEDYRAAEAQCHRHFQAFRTNGEWFSVPLQSIVEYMHGQVDWLEIDFECPGRVVQYLFFCKQGNMAQARDVLSRKKTPTVQLQAA
jgi:hypothetical protein